MGSYIMRKRKFVIGPSFRVSRDWILDYHYADPDYMALTEANKLRGIAPETMEFILLDGYWFNGVFQNDSDYYFYRHLLDRGAIEYRVYDRCR